MTTKHGIDGALEDIGISLVNTKEYEILKKKVEIYEKLLFEDEVLDKKTSYRDQIKKRLNAEYEDLHFFDSF